ncbi:MAG: DUF465 domain-containing protein [Rhodospirillaceae bacterium]|nr:DUF465 domain-containing protein [Rhodospirillaceae bacterium]MCA8934181.1 DUF465 domain-containing protein [Rhodospirillaceae bacterium]
MLDDPHDLASELPEYQDTIRKLAQDDAVFRDLLSSYNSLDVAIQDIELSGTPVADPTAEDLKKQRLWLKDRLFNRLAAAAA